MRYNASLTAGSLKLPESRLVADLLLRNVDTDGWTEAIIEKNILQARSAVTARRLGAMIRGRLKTMGPKLWTLVRDGSATVATHAAFAAAVKRHALLGDFLKIVVAEEYRRFSPVLSLSLFAPYVEGCRERDPELPAWTVKTQDRLRSSVFQMLAQVGYIDDTRHRRLQTVHIADQVLTYLKVHREEYVLHCIQVAP